MIEILPAAENVAAARVEGTVTADDVERFIGEVESKLAGHERIGLCVDAVGFDDMTGEALALRVRYGLSKLGQIDRFARAAVVSDKQWIAAVTGFVAPMLPRTQMRCFPSGSQQEALDWAADAR